VDWPAACESSDQNREQVEIMNGNAENSKLNVLVVDDDFLGRLGVGELLKLHGFQRTLAASGEDALQKLGTSLRLAVACFNGT
jgi:PleD family two-component response regulator